MYEVVTKGSEYELFPQGVITFMYDTVKDQISKYISGKKELQPDIIGSFGIADVPLNDGRKLNVWVEYNAKVMPFGLIDSGIHQCIIYDEIPDAVLDGYNRIKETIS